MKHKKFVKQLMAMGISRNTATAAAYAASRAEGPLRNVAARVQTMQRIFMRGMDWKDWRYVRKDFDMAVLDQAKRTQRPIRPLHRKKRGNCDGLRIDFAAVDEMATYTYNGVILPPFPKIEPSPAQSLRGYACIGLDLANGPDMTAQGGGGND